MGSTINSSDNGLIAIDPEIVMLTDYLRECAYQGGDPIVTPEAVRHACLAAIQSIGHDGEYAAWRSALPPIL